MIYHKTDYHTYGPPTSNRAAQERRCECAGGIFREGAGAAEAWGGARVPEGCPTASLNLSGSPPDDVEKMRTIPISELTEPEDDEGH